MSEQGNATRMAGRGKVQEVHCRARRYWYGMRLLQVITKHVLLRTHVVIRKAQRAASECLLSQILSLRSPEIGDCAQDNNPLEAEGVCAQIQV